MDIFWNYTMQQYLVGKATPELVLFPLLLDDADSPSDVNTNLRIWTSRLDLKARYESASTTSLTTILGSISRKCSKSSDAALVSELLDDRLPFHLNTLTFFSLAMTIFPLVEQQLTELTLN